MRFIFPLLALSFFLITGCATRITGYSKGDYVKEERSGKVQLLGAETVLTGKSNTSVRVEKIEKYGEVTVNYYEKNAQVTKRRPALNPFSLLVYNIPRGIMGAFYLIGGVFGNGRMFWNGLELLILPIPDCSSYGPFANSYGSGVDTICIESYYSELVKGEFETETSLTNITYKSIPVSSGTVSVSISEVMKPSFQERVPKYITKQEASLPDSKKTVTKVKNAKKAKKLDNSSLAKQIPANGNSQLRTPSHKNYLLNEEIPIQKDGTATFDIARYYDRLPKDSSFTIDFNYQEKTVKSNLTHSDLNRAMAARKPPQLEIARKIETEGSLTGGVLSGDEIGAMLVTVANIDKLGTAWGVNLAVSGNTCQEVTFDTLVKVGDLPPGETRKVRVPVSVGMNAPSCSLALTVQAREEFGQDSRKVNLTPLTIKPLERPSLHFAAVNQKGIAQNEEVVELEATVVNSGDGEAKGVTVRLADLLSGVSASHNLIQVGDMPPNSTQKVSTTLRFARKFGEQIKSVPIEFAVSDRRPLGKPTVKLYNIDYFYNKPILKISDLEFFDGNDQGGLSRGNANNLIEQGEWLLVRTSVTNSGTRTAENVQVSFTSDSPLSRLPIAPSEPVVIATLKPGETRKAEFKLKVSHSLEGNVAFKATASEQAFDSLVTETRMKRIYETSAEEGTLELQGSKSLAGRSAQSVPFSEVNIDEVAATDYRRNDAYALVIGIGRYKRVDSQLPYAIADARVMKDYLANLGGVPRDNIVLLTDDDATYTAIRSKLSWLARTAGKNSTVFIYYSGHGSADVKAGGIPYLLPYDVDPANLEDTGISMAELKQKINSFRTKTVLVALEACYSGGGHSIAVNGAHPIALVTDDGVLTESVILHSSRANEASWDHPELRHGIFTYSLLKGMRGAAAREGRDYIDANDLFEYVRREVPLVADKTLGVQQNPSKGGGDGKGLIISRRIQ